MQTKKSNKLSNAKPRDAAADGAPARTPVELANQPKEASAAAPIVSAPKGDCQWWFDARGLQQSDSETLDAAYQTNSAAIVMLPEQQKWIMTAKQKIVSIDRAEQLDRLEDGAWVLTDDEAVAMAARQAGRKSGVFVDVKDLETEFLHCIRVCKRGHDFVIIDIHNATYIPYELLLAETEHLPTRIMRSVPIAGLKEAVDEVNQSLNAFATMEQGVGVVFRSTNIKDIKELSAKIDERMRGKLELVEAEVTEVLHTVLGHRACVDTTTLMTNEEGMIVGSTGWGGIFVCSETHYLPHMNLREFRINAGGVHSYIWGPNDRHIYLSEVRAGTELLAVDIRGNTRVVTVGRVKIERRPLLLIKCKVEYKQDLVRDGKTIFKAGDVTHINTFLQNDWHVRIMGADAKVRNSTLVRPGEKLLAYTDVPGRHTGIRVTENILEK